MSRMKVPPRVAALLLGAIALACSAEPLSPGQQYNRVLRSCSLRDRASDDSPPHGAAEKHCPALEQVIRTMGPFRRRLWLEEVGPPSYDVVIDYLCLTPHFTRATVRGRDIFIPPNLIEDRGPDPLPTEPPPAEVVQTARKELFRLVPNAKDVHIVQTRVHRPLVVREFLRVGPAEILDTSAAWDATADLTDMRQRPRFSTLTRTKRPAFRTCAGRWFEAESPHHAEPSPMLAHALARRTGRIPPGGSPSAAPELLADLERALLVAARDENSRSEPDPQVEVGLLPPIEQRVELVLALYAQPGSRAVEHVVLRAETSALVFSGFEERKTVTLLGHEITVHVVVTPDPPPSRDVQSLDATASLSMAVHLESGGHMIHDARFTAKIPVVLDHGRAMTAGMSSRTHALRAGKPWERRGGDSSLTATLAPGDPPALVEVKALGLEPFSGVDRP